MSTHQTAKTQFAVNPSGTKYAYRSLGTGPGTPLLLLIHFRGTMDKWDPLLINNLAASRPLILYDYAGVGQSTGDVATTFRQAAADVIEFLSLVGEEEIDLLGFSIGGYVAQLVALNADPKTLKIRKLILAGTGTTAGPDVPASPNTDVGAIATGSEVSLATFQTLFFPKTREGKLASEQWWARIHERGPATSGEETSNFLSAGYLDGGKGIQAQGAQLQAGADPETAKGLDGAYERLGDLKMPVLVANGKDDYMIPTSISFLLQQKVPNGQLIMYPNSGHGFLYQYAILFAKHVLLFLEA
ncbi:alpha/beta-hydrolase [Coniochaeta ligniaria NRRL 30616]|uniref:Alpha/beta-hydrolase n=1 Tax=Coniochaeta ligniaria NRRL 30616 TaxID=1408157 RepID=A0A1J7J2E3_9PEZI|nr:alpha/beta-hydrolase [Coniochaeta ligniaria NRRL 30616]